MKIAYFVPDYTKPGGIERYVRQLARGLAERADIHVFTGVVPEDEPSKIVFHKVPMMRKPFFMQLFTFSHNVTNMILRSEPEFDILHNQGANARIQDVITAHSCHAAWVAHSRGIGIKEQVKKTLNPLHHVLLANEKYNYYPGRYKKIIAVSQNVKDELVRYHNLPSDDITALIPGVDISEFSPDKCSSIRNECRKRFGLTPEDKVVLLVANEFRRKGVGEAITALSLIGDSALKLYVVGEGDNGYYKLLARRCGVDKQVRFVNQTNRIVEYYSSADIFVLPTKYEPTGLVVLEAMACGLPVIISRVAGTSFLVKNENGLVLEDAYDSHELAAKIKALVYNNAVRESARRLSREKVVKYEWQNIVEDTYKIYVEAYEMKKRNSR
ncbi:MAG: glycosyltransferase family 4 protein [Elusimicrobiota bacterium]